MHFNLFYRPHPFSELLLTITLQETMYAKFIGKRAITLRFATATPKLY